MPFEPIRKDPKAWSVLPNLLNYDKARVAFNWDDVCQELNGLPDGASLNMAYEAVDRHAAGPHGGHLAIRWISKNNRIVDFSYADLRAKTNRFANLLTFLGAGKGDAVFIVAGRVPELYIAAFGPEPLQQRLSKGEAKVLVTTTRLYKRNIAQLRSSLPSLKHILLIDSDEDLDDSVYSFSKWMDAAADEFTIPPTNSEDIALLHGSIQPCNRWPPWRSVPHCPRPVSSGAGEVVAL